jgi:hypothetical protein
MAYITSDSVSGYDVDQYILSEKSLELFKGDPKADLQTCHSSEKLGY